MEADQGKLFIGGISWDTSEDRLREYFQRFGKVVEAVIMKDRTTGRARGFGFIVFADPAVAEEVVKEKHEIDGRMVEAKKAVPRDDQHILNRSNSSIHGSPPPTRTKKIFVGGLASTLTEIEFKNYFEQYGTITDVVVMYDQNTQRPRGFGFITYDSEDAVDKVLLKTFHELNGKMVEVKRAIPKELSPGPIMRSLVGGYNSALNRFNNFLNGYGQGHNPSSIRGYGMRVDDRVGSMSGGRSGLSSYGFGYGTGMNLDPGMSPSYGGNPNYSNSLGYLRGMGPYYGGNWSRYSSSIGYGGGDNINTGSMISLMARDAWGNGGLNYSPNSANSSAYLASGSGSLDGFGNSNLGWRGSPAPISAQGAGSGSSYASGNLGFGSGENIFSFGATGLARSIGTGTANTSFPASSTEYGGANADLYSGSSLYGDTMWRSGSSDLDMPGPFGYGLGNAASDITTKGTAGFAGSYNVMDRQANRRK